MKQYYPAGILIIIFLTSFALTSCQSTKSKTNQAMDQSVEFVDIKEAANYDIPFSGTTVIKNKGMWYQWWKQYWNRFSGSGEKTPPPEIDFDKQMIVAVHWGEGYSGCLNRVDVIDKIEKTLDSINVVVTPLPHLGPCDMVVYPIQMVKIPRMDLLVRFSGSTPDREN